MSGASATGGGSCKRSHRSADSEPLDVATEPRPESAAAGCLRGRIALDRQRRDLSALVVEILLRGGESFLAGAAVFEMIEHRLQIGLRNRDDGGSFGGV
jgi:hypothetical protein